MSCSERPDTNLNTLLDIPRDVLKDTMVNTKSDMESVSVILVYIIIVISCHIKS